MKRWCLHQVGLIQVKTQLETSRRTPANTINLQLSSHYQFDEAKAFLWIEEHIVGFPIRLQQIQKFCLGVVHGYVTKKQPAPSCNATINRLHVSHGKNAPVPGMLNVCVHRK